MNQSRYLTTWARRRSHAWAVGLLALAVVLALVAAFVRFYQPPERYVPPEPAPSAEESVVAPALQPAREVRIGPGTQVVYRVRYAESGRLVTEVHSAPREMLNLTEGAVRRLYPQYTVTEFTAARVVLSMAVEGSDPEGFAEERRIYRTISLQDGYVAIFAGKWRPGAPLLRVTSISARHLPLRERELLRKGIEVKGDEEVAQYLEGYEE